MSEALLDLDDLLPPAPVGHEWLQVAHGESGDRVYRRSDGAAYAKLSSASGIAKLDGERRRLEWLAGTGVSGPAVLDWVAREHGACLLMSSVRGVPASELSLGQLKTAWPSIAEQIKSLHQVSIEACPFDRALARMIDKAEDVVARNAVNPDFLPPEDRHLPPVILLSQLRAEFPQRLAQERDDLVVCHGDACLPNLMVDPETLRCTGVVDLGRLGLADRYADLALLVANARESWTGPAEENAAREQLFRTLGIPVPDRGRLSFYLRLDPLTWG